MTNAVVPDASVLVNCVLGENVGDHILALLAQTDLELHVPPHVDAEALNAFYRRFRRKELSRSGLSECVAAFSQIPLYRHGGSRLAEQAYGYIDAVGAYDSFYVALAEQLCCPLATSDQRLARAVRASLPQITVVT